MILSNKVMRGDKPKLCLLVATLAFGYTWAGKPCERRVTWWDRERGACMPCTRCDPEKHLVVQLPCELHRDTICQSLYQIHIWPFFAPTNDTKDVSEPSDYEYEYSDYDSDVNDDGAKQWDLQTLSVVLAASGCVVFFIVVLYVSLSHAKQWKVLKQTLQSDMKDLTAKIKLMEAGGEPPSEPPSPTDRHIYCNIHVGKDALLGPAASKKGLGNVYTQEKHPS
ncbi:tumor necrosis factor receptor superfamily member wengen [Aphomia sociella]